MFKGTITDTVVVIDDADYWTFITHKSTRSALHTLLFRRLLYLIINSCVLPTFQRKKELRTLSLFFF